MTEVDAYNTCTPNFEYHEIQIFDPIQPGSFWKAIPTPSAGGVKSYDAGRNCSLIRKEHVPSRSYGLRALIFS